MNINRSNFFLLLSFLLIFSNKFGFLMFLRERNTTKRCFANARAKEIYGTPRLSNSEPFTGLVPSGAVSIKDLTSNEHFLKRQIAVRRGNAHEHLEEMTFRLGDDETGSYVIIKTCFVDSFSLRMN